MSRHDAYRLGGAPELLGPDSLLPFLIQRHRSSTANIDDISALLRTVIPGQLREPVRPRFPTSTPFSIMHHLPQMPEGTLPPVFSVETFFGISNLLYCNTSTYQSSTPAFATPVPRSILLHVDLSKLPSRKGIRHSHI